MVQGAPEIVRGIAGNRRCLVRDGFVLFGERGALAGYCVRLNDISEWSLFTQEGVKLVDAFRSSLEL
jgi:hypothetical protein